MTSAPMACDAASGDAIEETVMTGGTVLRCDPVANQFIYNWQTFKSWAGCRVLQLTLLDDTKYYAKFNFK